MTDFVLEIAGELRGRASFVEDAKPLTEFATRLAESEKLDPAEAKELVGSLVVSTLIEVGGRWAREMSSHVEAIFRIRDDLRMRYRRVVELYSGRGGPGPRQIPPELQPEALRGLFIDLRGHIEEIRGFEDWAVKQGRSIEDPAGLGSELEQIAHGEPPQEEGVLPGEPEPPRRGGAGQLAESERLERLYYMRLRRTEPAQERAIIDEAAQAFFGQGGPYGLPAGWRVWPVRSGEYGARVPQQAAFGALDPLFAGHGYELHFTAPDGLSFQPDGVELRPDGTFRFLEYKDPLKASSMETYRSSPDLQAELRQTLIRRAEAAQSLPNCIGWRYDTSLPDMNAYIFDVLDTSLPDNSPLRALLEVADPTGRKL